MSNIITRPHSRHSMRHISNDKRRKIQYDMDKRREEQGKTVIHLHEKPPKPKSMMPTSEDVEPLILDFYNKNGANIPTKMVIPFIWGWKDHSFIVQNLPGVSWDMNLDNRHPWMRQGFFIGLEVFYDENAEEIRFE